MAKRSLCQKHLEQESVGLTLIQQLHIDWQEVEPCELCAAERADLRAALEELLKQLKYCESLLGDEYDTSEPSPAEDQARAALAGAGEAGDS